MADFISIKSNFQRKAISKALNGVEIKLVRKLRSAVRESMNVVKQNISEEAPNISGGLKQSILELPTSNVRKRGLKIVKGKGHMTISVSLNRQKDRLIIWVDKGTGIYGPKKRRIVAKNGGMLAFEVNGELIFRKSVKGMKPRRFISKGIKKSIPEVARILKSALKI